MRFWPLLTSALILTGCTGGQNTEGSDEAAATLPPCDSTAATIELPDGFCAVVVADVVAPRHLAVAPNGDLYVSSRGRPNATAPEEQGGVFALRDTTGDGVADERAFFAKVGTLGPLTYGRVMQAQNAPPSIRGGRLDIKV